MVWFAFWKSYTEQPLFAQILVLRGNTSFQTWEQDPETFLIIIKGTGGKAFCAGGDIRGKDYTHLNIWCLSQSLFCVHFLCLLWLG